MASDDDASAEIARLRRAATKKISRLKIQKDVFISGTSEDPRRDLAQTRKYNADQMRRYAQTLRQFIHRSNQYVPDSHHRPIEADRWNEYKALERAYAEKVSAYFAHVESIKLPSNETIGERMAKMTPNHKRTFSPAVNAIYDAPNRRSRAVAGKKELDKLIAKMHDMLHPDYFTRRNGEGKSQLNKMLNTIGDKKLGEKVEKLTPGQFALLWNYTQFPTAVSITYEVALKMLTQSDKPYHAGLRRDAIHDYEKMVKWASEQRV